MNFHPRIKNIFIKADQETNRSGNSQSLPHTRKKVNDKIAGGDLSLNHRQFKCFCIRTS